MPTQLTSHDRFTRAYQHKTADRVPITDPEELWLIEGDNLRSMELQRQLERDLRAHVESDPRTRGRVEIVPVATNFCNSEACSMPSTQFGTHSIRVCSVCVRTSSRRKPRKGMVNTAMPFLFERR